MDSLLNEYIDAHISPEPPNLARLFLHTHRQLLYPHMCSGHQQGRLLKMLTAMIRPQRVLELGTYSGYSALCIAEGLPDDSCRVHTVEVNDEHEDFIRAHLAESAVGHRVVLHIGNAIEVLQSGQTGHEPFDMVLIDADKRDYCSYYRLVLPMVRPGGYILADNTLWAGKVADSRCHDALTNGIRAFNDLVAADTTVETVIIPLRDGLTIIRKRG